MGHWVVGERGKEWKWEWEKGRGVERGGEGAVERYEDRRWEGQGWEWELGEGVFKGGGGIEVLGEE